MMYWGDHMGTSGWIFSILATLAVNAIALKRLRLPDQPTQ